MIPDSFDVTSAAVFVFAARHGSCTLENRETGEFKDIVRELATRYDGPLTAEQIMNEVENILAEELRRRGQ